MVNVNELMQENQMINDLSAVLGYLIESEGIRSNQVFCELMQRFNKSVESHLSHEERSVYSKLLNHDDKQIHEVATQFMSNTHELRKLMKDYSKKWCDAKAIEKDSEFVDSTREIFHLVNHRIDMENSKLFPAINA